MRRQPRSPGSVGFDAYEGTLAPALLDRWERGGTCWVLTGSTQAGRALADPGAAPGAVAFYRGLAQRGALVFRASPSDRAILVMASGVNRVDEAALAALLGESIAKADAAFVRERTGFAIGGVAPVGHRSPSAWQSPPGARPSGSCPPT